MDEAQYTSPYPVGFCQCGCGEKTNFSPKAYIRQGIKAGDPWKYIAGHNSRKSPHEYLVEDRGYADSPCWIWQRGKVSTGYGFTTRNSKRILAHRAYYQEYVGPIPHRFQVDHLCFQRDCVNPAHLEAVSQSENLRRSRVRQGFA